MARRSQNQTYSRCPLPSHDPGQDRALAPDPEEPHPAGKLLPARRPRSPDRGLRRRLQPLPIPREHRQSHPGPSTSDAALPSWQNEKGSNDTPSTIAAFSIACTPPDTTNPMSQSPLNLPSTPAQGL